MLEPVSEAVIGRPPDALSPFVEGYMGYRQQGYAPGNHRCLPGRHLGARALLGFPAAELAGIVVDLSSVLS